MSQRIDFIDLSGLNMEFSVIFSLLIFVVTSLSSLFVAKILDSKYGRCLIGKF